MNARRVGPFLVLLAFAAFVSLGLPDTVLGVAWPSLRGRFGLPQEALGAVLAATLPAYAISSAFAPRLGRHLALGGLLAASSGLVALGLLGYALAPRWAAFVPMGVLIGAGSGAIDASLNAFAAHHLPARTMNWLHACYSLGATVGPALMTGVLAGGARYTAGYATLAAALGAMALAFALTRRAWTDGDAPGAAQRDGDRAPAFHALRRGRVWLQLAVFVVYTGIEAGTGAWCFSVLHEARGLRVAAAGAWTTAYFASILAGRVAFGFVVDRVGPDRLLRAVTVSAVAGAALFALAPGLAGRLGVVLLGLAIAPVFPTLMARTPARMGADVAAQVIGFQVSAATIGAALLPSGIGFLADGVGLAAAPLAILGDAALLLALHEVLLAVVRARPARGRAPLAT